MQARRGEVSGEVTDETKFISGCRRLAKVLTGQAGAVLTAPRARRRLVATARLSQHTMHGVRWLVVSNTPGGEDDAA